MTAATVLRASVAAVVVVALPGALGPARADAPIGLPSASTEATKLKTIVLSLDFNNASIAEATNFLRVESKHLDPDHKGFNFVISPEASASAQPATLELNNVTFEQALQSVCAQANVKYQVEGGVIHILSLAENPALQPPAIGPDDKAAQATMTRLHAIVIDKVNFQNLDVAVLVQFLAQKSKEIDPDHRGVNFVLGNIKPDAHVHREVSIVLENVPLSDVLQYVKQQTNLNYSIGDNIVTFKP